MHGICCIPYFVMINIVTLKIIFIHCIHISISTYTLVDTSLVNINNKFCNQYEHYHIILYIKSSISCSCDKRYVCSHHA